MKTCPNCHSEIPDEAVFCPVCGTAVETIPAPLPRPDAAYSSTGSYAPPAPVDDPYDHTKDFEQADISENKLLCMLVYLLDFIGIIIALLGAKDSPFVRFHIRQSMKYTVLEILLTVIVVLLCWTVVVPILGAAALIVLVIIKLVSFCNVCCGKAVEPHLIRGIGFLK